MNFEFKLYLPELVLPRSGFFALRPKPEAGHTSASALPKLRRSMASEVSMGSSLRGLSFAAGLSAFALKLKSTNFYSALCTVSSSSD